eukprot:CAMPEP_0171208240 /NCGR_PEP_ID=MMETSP0790-20130122/27988_1 /TAXON_ID=2925 /ORGANISM="Alexandrium catenella, Strain OF101" /LENGTH=56 /DNA_ID=CAMNT_0011673833 /DNA_START=74 /DNA_END=241 /DNA_ORIENTATION=-
MRAGPSNEEVALKAMLASPKLLLKAATWGLKAAVVLLHSPTCRVGRQHDASSHQPW